MDVVGDFLTAAALLGNKQGRGSGLGTIFSPPLLAALSIFATERFSSPACFSRGYGDFELGCLLQGRCLHLAYYWRSAPSCSCSSECVRECVLWGTEVAGAWKLCMCSQWVRFAAPNVHAIVYRQLERMNALLEDWNTIVIVWGEANMISVCTPAQLISRQHLPPMRAIH